MRGHTPGVSDAIVALCSCSESEVVVVKIFVNYDAGKKECSILLSLNDTVYKYCTDNLVDVYKYRELTINDKHKLSISSDLLSFPAIFVEKTRGDLNGLILSTQQNYADFQILFTQLINILFQICYTYFVLYHTKNFRHNDFHAGNILISQLDDTEKRVSYILNNSDTKNYTYFMFTRTYSPKLWDFEKSTFDSTIDIATDLKSDLTLLLSSIYHVAQKVENLEIFLKKHLILESFFPQTFVEPTAFFIELLMKIANLGNFIITFTQDESEKDILSYIDYSYKSRKYFEFSYKPNKLDKMNSS